MNLREQAKTLLEKAAGIRNENPREAIALAEKTLELLDYRKETDLLARAYLSIGLSCKVVSELARGLEALNHAGDLYAVLDDNDGLSDALSTKSNFLFLLGEHEQALTLQNKALELREKSGDPRRIAYSINSLGVIHATLNDFQVASEYFQKTLDENRKNGDYYGQTIALNNLAVASVEQKQFEKALDYLNQASEVALKADNAAMLIELKINKADALRGLNRLEEAKTIYLDALALQTGLKNIAEGRNYTGLARLYLLQENYNEAALMAANALEIFEKVGVNEQIAESVKLQSDIEKSRGNFSLSMELLNRFFEIREKIHSDELRKRTESLGMIHKADSLKKESEIFRLKNIELKEAGEILAEKNQRIMDSLRYAEYIQDKIFSGYEKDVWLKLPGSFFISFPLEVVNGDFLWFYETRNHYWIVLADCTGHGVPGALVSVMGNEILNKAIQKLKEENMDAFISLVNENLVQQEDEELSEIGKVGFDFSLVLTSKKDGKAIFSGCRMHAVAADKQGNLNWIRGGAGFPGTRGFELPPNHSLEGFEQIFLFSDGLTDLIIDDNKTRLGKQGVLDLISEAMKQNASDRETFLKTKLEKWVKDKPQFDDISLFVLNLSS